MLFTQSDKGRCNRLGLFGTAKPAARKRYRPLAFQQLEHRQMLSAGALLDPTTFVPLDPLSADGGTGEKPQSKVWEYDDSWWSVLPNGSGTWLWRLDDTTWNPVLQISEQSGVNADVKPMGDLAHVLLYDGTTSQLASVEHLPGGAGGYGM